MNSYMLFIVVFIVNTFSLMGQSINSDEFCSCESYKTSYFMTDEYGNQISVPMNNLSAQLILGKTGSTGFTLNSPTNADFGLFEIYDVKTRSAILQTSLNLNDNYKIDLIGKNHYKVTWYIGNRTYFSVSYFGNTNGINTIVYDNRNDPGMTVLFGCERMDKNGVTRFVNRMVNTSND